MKLEAHDLTFSYDGGTYQADHISLTLEPGCFTVLLGPNGCGKSTLLRLLTGELTPESGSVLLDGRPVREWSGRERALRLGVVLQSAPPALAFTVREYVTMGRSPRLPVFGPVSAEDRRRIAEAMEIFGVTALAERPCHTLSGGERQRVMLAAAWADDPGVLLLDEPVSAADPAQTLLILKALRKKSEQAAVFMISHDLSLSANFADRLLLSRHGRILASGTPSAVLTPENIRALYDVDALILHSPDGISAVLPKKI